MKLDFVKMIPCLQGLMTKITLMGRYQNTLKNKIKNGFCKMIKIYRV